MCDTQYNNVHAVHRMCAGGAVLHETLVSLHFTTFLRRPTES